MFLDAKNEKNWLLCRHQYLTASDSANYCGVNPYDSEGMIHLWQEKTGIKERADIGNNPAVIFGKQAEPILRSLFLAEHPEFVCKYDQFGLYISQERRFMAATLDGLLIDAQGNWRILEIKTATVRTLEALKVWSEGDKLPIQYFTQVLHQLYCVPKAVGTYVYAFVRTEWNPEESYIFTRYFDANDADLKSDMRWLLKQADKMHVAIETKKEPNVA